MQPVDITSITAGKKVRKNSPRRVSACDLAPHILNRIVDLMTFHGCSDKVAELAQTEFRGIRITAKTVSDAIDIVLLRNRKPPVSAAASISTASLGHGALTFAASGSRRSA